MDPKTNFRLIVIQTELERFKFLVRSFLRARIAKVSDYMSPFPPVERILSSNKNAMLIYLPLDRQAPSSHTPDRICPPLYFRVALLNRAPSAIIHPLSFLISIPVPDSVAASR